MEKTFTVECSKCHRKVKISREFSGKLDIIGQTANMVPIFRHRYDSFIKGWECLDKAQCKKYKATSRVIEKYHDH